MCKKRKNKQIYKKLTIYCKAYFKIYIKNCGATTVIGHFCIYIYFSQEKSVNSGT
jgi:hypothetical protein